MCCLTGKDISGSNDMILTDTFYMYVLLTGPVEQFYYRGDKKFHFLNWLVITDVTGEVVLSRPGFLGHCHDNTCLG